MVWEGGESGDRQEEVWCGMGESGDRQEVWGGREGRVGIDRRCGVGGRGEWG